MGPMAGFYGGSEEHVSITENFLISWTNIK